MKPNERGYSLIELLIGITITVLASGAAGGAIFQILKNTERNSDHMTVVRQVQNAGYWISHDAQMALSVTTTDNLTLPDFLALSWTTWNGTSGNPVYHSTNYTFENLTNGTGTLKRNYQNSDGADQTMLVAQYIYYESSDTANTSNVSYQSPVLTLKITSVFEGMMETREYRIKRRTNLF